MIKAISKDKKNDNIFYVKNSEKKANTSLD